MLELKNDQGVLTVSTSQYKLVFPLDRPFVIVRDVENRTIMELFALSSIHSTAGLDDTTTKGNWEVADDNGRISLAMRASSSLWEKKVYYVHCYPERFTYEIEIQGEGLLTQANYFGGYYSGHTRWGSGFFYSGNNCAKGFNPEPNVGEENYFSPQNGSVVDLTGVPLPGRGDWFYTPTPFWFGFKHKAAWVGMGVCAQPGANRFTEFAYHGQLGFHLSLAYEGHTKVSGITKLPVIGFDFANNEYEALSKHIASLEALNYINTAPKRQADWWHTPIYCGWGSQCYLASLDKGHAPSYAKQELYDGFMRSLDENGVRPGIVVIDDKWQDTYGKNVVDEEKWPDLPGFIAEQHSKGSKVLLWLKAWDPEGLPDDECIQNAAGLPIACDPTNPKSVARFRRSIRQMLSSGGYDADGFKIDFTARIPSGPGIKLYGDAWGLELMKAYLEIIYSEAKQVKDDALVMAHTPHPYLADVVDMIRLNDINTGRDVNRAMTHRAKVAQIACANLVIDTDNWPITDRAAWREYVKIQPELGVPSLYYASHIDSTKEPLTPEDYELIRSSWQAYQSRRRG